MESLTDIYKERYSSEEEANERHSDIAHLLDRSLGFCPQIGSDCRTDCVCYQKSMVALANFNYGKSKDKEYRIRPPCCIHPFILGEINVIT